MTRKLLWGRPFESSSLLRTVARLEKMADETGLNGRALVMTILQNGRRIRSFTSQYITMVYDWLVQTVGVISQKEGVDASALALSFRIKVAT